MGLAALAHAAGLVETFNANPVLSSTSGPGVWYTDRYNPAGFTSAVFDGDRRLKHSISAADCEPCRPGGFNSAFYSTQGRNFQLPAGTTSHTIQLYVPSDWATSGKRMAGFWGVAYDAGNAVSSYPILEFTQSPDGSGQPRFRGWDNATGLWVDMGLPTGFTYDRWYTLSVKLVGGNWVYQVGDLSLTTTAGTSTRIGSTLLQGHNTVGGVSYDIYWDNLFTNTTAGITLSAPSCSTNNVVTVNVDLSGASENVVGGQFFLDYDQTRLQLVSAVPGNAPFTLEVFESHNMANGTLDYAVGVPFGNLGTSADTTMATLTFNWIAGADSCSTGANLVEFRTHNPITRLTNAVSEPISPTLTPMASITVDTTDPVITCPPSVTLNADAGQCTASLPSILRASGWRIFGDTTISQVPSTSNFIANISSIVGNPSGFSGIIHTLQSPTTFASLSYLGMDYRVTQGCWGAGSPRFQLAIDTDLNGTSNGNVFVYVATPPNFNDCPPIGVWQNTGNLLAATDLRFDLTQFGGNFYSTYAQAVSLLGSGNVLSANLVMDSSFVNNMAMDVDNINVGGAVQSFNDATATDNCGSPTVVGVRSDSQPLSAPYPTGTTTITWTATDGCGNDTPCVQTITVNPFNTVTATVRLESVVNSPSFTRCITFGTDTCSNFYDVPITFTNGVGSASFDVPCGVSSCFTARDKKHTLRGTKLATISGPNYVLSFTGADQLIGGNINDDSVIDILDFGGFIGQFSQNVGASTLCGASGLHADFSGNGIVDPADFTYVQIHFLNFAEADCCGNVRPQGVQEISVDELNSTGREEIAMGDVNRDGWLNGQDVEVWVAHGGFPTCTQDFNGDGDAGTDADIEAFFACLGGTCCHTCGSSDFNGDGDIGTDQDIESFFRVLGGGAC